MQESTATSARQREECSAGTGGGNRDRREPRYDEVGADLNEASHFVLAASAGPNV